MLKELVAAVMLLTVAVDSLGKCKDPAVVQRLMADDVRYAAPFYVLALPKTPITEQVDNVCYTYYESGNGSFFHIMSIVYHNGSNSYHKFTKADIADRIGLAQGTADASSCVYHDYTLTPICNVSVFILYRCFIEGNCNNIDIGITQGVDVRVVLAATTTISDTCRIETETSLNDTSSLEGGDYIILPQARKPQCVTNFNGMMCINAQNALGSITIEDLNDRFGDSNDDLSFSGGISTVPSLGKENFPELGQPNTRTVSSTATEVNPVTIPQTTVPRRSYADVVKSSPPAIRPGVKGPSNVYNHVHKWNRPSTRDC